MTVPMLKQLAAAAVVAQFLGLASAAALPLQARDGAEPGLPHASDTTSYCSWWADYDGSQTCQEVLDFNWIDLKSFRRWNPSVGSDCSGIKAGNSYCVEAYNEPTPPPEAEETTTTKAVVTTTAAPTSTKAPTTIITTTTTTSAGSGVETPEPVQGGIVKNCNKFHFVASGDSCAAIAQKYGLTVAQFASFNGLNGGCTNLWGDTYACVGLIGGNPAQTTAPAQTTTAPSNGVQTPEPVHNGIVGNCNKFYMVKSGDSCASIAQKNSIRTADVVSWNGLNSGCTNLWLDTYACVGLVGGNPAPPATTTKTAGNGVQTPEPVHNGIVGNCNKFYMVKSGDSCASIAQKNSIRTADVVSWNGLNSGCTNLWLDTYACVGLVGGSPTVPQTTTTTKAGNGIQTPQPVHTGIASNCNKFYMVKSGDSCASIAQKNSIRTADVVSWNGLNSGCTNLWLDTYACIGVVGGSPTVPQPATTTKAGNGIQTPQPTQPGIAANCDKFHFVSDGDTCAKIASANGISAAQFAQWNGLNSGCSNLWGSAYACVRVVGTPTSPGNGGGGAVQTPQPTQGSIVAGCKLFEFVRSGDTCDVVAKRRGVTVKQLTTWNPSIGSDCTKLWANAYACVGV
ncbi:LysM domain-containing protein [Colletotrichum higginsianum]|uniref:LysM domain-containing protein n=1 Tax=Colletotrichum higginsianum TaxID=80884 RepID=A0A4T0WM05_9PEZI|nr:LysM domain-containing protein [Colletotrichum higginsianum]